MSFFSYSLWEVFHLGNCLFVLITMEVSFGTHLENWLKKKGLDTYQASGQLPELKHTTCTVTIWVGVEGFLFSTT